MKFAQGVSRRLLTSVDKDSAEMTLRLAEAPRIADQVSERSAARASADGACSDRRCRRGFAVFGKGRPAYGCPGTSSIVGATWGTASGPAAV